MKRMTRRLLGIVVSSAVALPMAAQVQADEMQVEPHSHPAAYEHEHEMEDGSMSPLHAHEHESHPHAEFSQLHGHGFAISGHLGRAIVITDSGNTDVSHGDMGASPSRFRVTASEALEGGITAGMSLEYGAGNDANANPNLRQAHIYLSGDFGRLAIGQQSSATDGVAYASYNGTAALGGVEVGCDYCSADFITAYGHGRAEGIKYTTPGIGPASVSVFSDADDVWNAAINLSGGAAGGAYQINAGYSEKADGTENIVVSGAVKLPTGMHANMAWGQTDADDSDFTNFGVGYVAGSTAIAANYYTSDISGGGDGISVGVGQGLGDSLTLFASYMNLSYDDDMNGDDAVDSENLVVIGARVMFN